MNSVFHFYLGLYQVLNKLLVIQIYFHIFYIKYHIYFNRLASLLNYFDIIFLLMEITKVRASGISNYKNLLIFLLRLYNIVVLTPIRNSIAYKIFNIYKYKVHCLKS